MADISMCYDDECPSRGSCYRFMATPSLIWQTYTLFYRNAEDDKCVDYWPMENK